MSNGAEKNYETFDHWDTTPEPVAVVFSPTEDDPVNAQEYKMRRDLDKKGDPMYENAPYITDLDEMELG